MGIRDLLRDLRHSFQDVDIKYLKDKTVGIDVSIWIYQGGVQYVLRMVDHLRRNGVNCVLVFDGEELEAKKKIVADRRKRRSNLVIEAHELEKEGKLEEAARLREKCFRNTLQHRSFIQEWCRTRGVTYYQSPYEADAQLAYLSKQKEIDVVITEDSDLIVYGCEKILFKFDGQEGELYDRQKLQKTWVDPFKPKCLRAVCILIGSDYFKGGLYNFGIKKAQDLYKEMSEPFDFEQMTEILGEDVDEDDFMIADTTFDRQLVIDPETKDIVPLIPYPDGMSGVDFPYAGNLEHSKSTGRAHVFVPKTTIPPPDLNGRPFYGLTFQCSKCPDKLFASRKALRTHRETDHPVGCHVCGKKYRCHALLLDHMKKHETTPSFDYKCLDCGRVFLQYMQLSGHRIVHLGKRHICQICQQRFFSASHLHVHMWRHTGFKAFTCGECSKSFTTRGELQIHQVVHTKEKAFACSFCGKLLGSSSALIRHEATHNTDTQGFVCATCGKGFRVKAYLRKHETTHEIERQRFFCPTCGKGFLQKQQLRVHESTHKTNQPRFACVTCGKGFNHKGTLDRHEATHETDRPRFSCSTCGKSFLSKASLRVHESTHDPEKQKCKCPTCGKCFPNKCQLRLHEYSHSTEKKFICSYCGNTYQQPCSLRHHKKVCPKLKNQDDNGEE